MKKRMKSVLWMLLLITESFNAPAQTICLSGGQTLMPGVYAGLRYEHYTNSQVNLAAGLFAENSNRNDLRYRSYGLDLLVQYNPGDDNEKLFSCKASFGATAQIEEEPWVYKAWSFWQRVNYGIIAEIKGEWLMTKIFGLALFGQQKYFFNQDLGHASAVFGLSLSYHFNN